MHIPPSEMQSRFTLRQQETRMKLAIATLLAAIPFLSLAPALHAAPDGNPAEVHVSRLAEVRERFVDPPAAFRPAPLYVWNDDMQEDELAWQLDEMHEQGYGGVFVHPRPGLVTPYLSDRWLKLWRFTLDEAKKRGMVTYIYDENSYPSGFAGGHVPEEMPESRGMALGFNRIEPDKLNDLVVSADSVALYKLTGDEKGFEPIPIPKMKEGETRTAADLKLEKAAYLHIALNWAGKSDWLGGRFYVDLMRPGVGEKFLEITLGAYDKVLKDEYAENVLAFFTDEPNIHAAGGFPWTPGLPAAFESKFGYKIEDHLPSLQMDIGDWRRVRHDYAVILLHLFEENFFKPLHNSCEERGICFTGHVWEHGWPNISHGPDTMTFNAWQQMPGIDNLMNEYSEGPNAQFGNWRASIEVRSIANQFGRQRILCETYGAGGWELTFEDMKRIGDWLYVGGINLLNPHLSYYTIRGARKRDHPQSFSYHAPYWEAYHISMDYFGRLSWALTAGEELNEILVIEPTTSAWMYNWSQGQREKLQTLGNDFQRFVTELSARWVEYDLGSEPVMAWKASVDGARLVVGERAYETVVLPPGLDNLESSTVKLLEAFAENGGRIVSCVGVPEYVDGRSSKDVQSIKRKAGGRWIEEPVTPENAAKWSYTPVRLTATDVKDGRVYHYLRTLEDGHLLFVVNTSLTEASTGHAAALGGSVELWDAADGSFNTVNFAKSRSGAVSWDFHLPPAGSALFAITNGSKSSGSLASTKDVQDREKIAPIGRTKVDMVGLNAVPLDYVDLVLNGEVTKGIYFYDAQTKIYQAHGFSRNPWDSAVQYEDEILAKDHFSEDSGFELRYPFTVGAFDSMPELQFVVERGDRYAVTVNGHAVSPLTNAWWLDRSFNVYKIDSTLLKPGRNEIATVGKPFTLHHEPESVYVLGDFTLKSAAKGWTLEPAAPLRLGSWKKQGRPCYHGRVTYTQEYNIKNKDARYAVELADWEGTVARVDVNGEEAGYIGWAPWRLDITDKIQSGKNQVTVTVFGSLKNLLGPHHAGPIRGRAWPHIFRQNPKEGQPEGSAYDVMDYGLNSPFMLQKVSEGS